MNCTEFELRLSEGQDTPEHREQCEQCDQLFTAFQSIDAELTQHYAAVFAPPVCPVNVPRSLAIADALDFIGWGGVALIVACAVWYWLPPAVLFTGPVLVVAFSILLALAFIVTVWLFRHEPA